MEPKFGERKKVVIIVPSSVAKIKVIVVGGLVAAAVTQ
jgi:hypothetical protein